MLTRTDDPRIRQGPVRVVTAAALFDGHDAAISIVRRMLQDAGAEVIHLGHDRSVDAVVRAAVEEDAHAVAVSSYQGGHVEYFGYLVQRLAEVGAGHVRVFGGGGAVIVPAEVAALARRGVRIFTPEDGRRLGLAGMAEALLADCPADLAGDGPDLAALRAGAPAALARAITVLEAGRHAELAAAVRQAAADRRAEGGGVPVLGITGTGGSGKSTLTDELLRRLHADDPALRVAIIAVDPTRRRGGALLGDRIRMNALAPGDRTTFRSMATRVPGAQLPERLDDVVAACIAAGNDLVVVETPGTGQGDAAIVDHCDVALYVMTPEFGAQTQLEKIDMLDLADVVAVNKVERPAGADALRAVTRQVARNRGATGAQAGRLPVFGTSAAAFADPGVTRLHRYLRGLLAAAGGDCRAVPAREGGDCRAVPAPADDGGPADPTGAGVLIPAARARHLAEIAETVRGYHRHTAAQAGAVRRCQHLRATLELLGDDPAAERVGRLLAEARAAVAPEAAALLDAWPELVRRYGAETLTYEVRGRAVTAPLRRTTLAGSPVPRVALPRITDRGDLLRFLRAEHLPGFFPFTAGVFRLKRADESPTRMFAGEGDPARTNRRFRLLAAGGGATRLSTAFDPVTLYGRDPDPRPDVYGRIGTSGVSVATIDDMRDLYAGFDLCAPGTSVSMTVNGPAPTILAMFLNTAIDQRTAAFVAGHGREPDAAEAAELRRWVLANVRGTVQADILKEEQGQNTCIFSTAFALRCMADVQEYFVEHRIRNFYSVSVSGYHIAEAGANPITQLAFTLANGFTYVEAFLARGMAVDDVAPSLSFFFSNGMDAEYPVLGRVARRIWAVAMRERYGAAEGSQRLKYHIQTSGRSLHAREMSFNDIRTTLQALCAVYDNCNSLHTNAFDEAVTTPSEESVRRALAIQLIVDREWGLAGNENPLQGSFVIEELTDLVEEAVLAEFERISERGGVLGAMETGYQRGRIQDESMRYERGRHDGSLPVIGVNTFLAPDADARVDGQRLPLARATEAEKQSQLRRLADFHARNRRQAAAALAEVRSAAATGGNVFAALMDAVRTCSLGQISQALFEVGGEYRRSM